MRASRRAACRTDILAPIAACFAAILALGIASPASAQDEASMQSQYEAARKAADWPSAESVAEQLVAAHPKNWDYQRELADAQLGAGKNSDAAGTYQTAVSLAEASSSGAPRAAITAMLTNEGGANIKLHNTDIAIALFEKAARLDPHPALAYFNLCATQYNAGRMPAALLACDEAIKFDPNRADAYFIKGSVMFGNATIKADGKTSLPPGTVTTLKKYLTLAPNGGHADDVKQMLDFAAEDKSK